MPWAHNEPEELQKKIDLLREFRGKFDLDQDYVYGIFNLEESAALGGTGLHTRRGEDIREIGYWIHKEHTNKGLGTESTTALVKVAFEIDEVKWVEIRCDPENEPSVAIPRKLGFTHDTTLRDTGEILGEQRDEMVWILPREGYLDSPASEAEIEAFDVYDRRLI
jgi:RimJ/RimL family protein N-acetyltransferase